VHQVNPAGSIGRLGAGGAGGAGGGAQRCSRCTWCSQSAGVVVSAPGQPGPGCRPGAAATSRVRLQRSTWRLATGQAGPGRGSGARCGRMPGPAGVKARRYS